MGAYLSEVSTANGGALRPQIVVVTLYHRVFGFVASFGRDAKAVSHRAGVFGRALDCDVEGALAKHPSLTRISFGVARIVAGAIYHARETRDGSVPHQLIEFLEEFVLIRFAQIHEPKEIARPASDFHRMNRFGDVPLVAKGLCKVRAASSSFCLTRTPPKANQSYPCAARFPGA